MPDFSKRSTEKELLDSSGIPFEDIKQNMRELEVINSRLGGHRVTIAGISQIFKRKGIRAGDTVSVCEIGCGGGDNLVALIDWAKKRGILIHAVGIDINPECIAYAKQKLAERNITFICSDFKAGLKEYGKADIIFSSLFCHHFSNEELVFMFKWMQDNSALGVVVNDLHRHWLAYYSIKILTSLFSGSYLVRNDAPVSVKRGFKKDELHLFLERSGISSFEIRWRWAFRWLLIF